MGRWVAQRLGRGRGACCGGAEKTNLCSAVLRASSRVCDASFGASCRVHSMGTALD